MDDLKEQRCLPCEGGVETLDRPQAEDYLAKLSSGWALDERGKELRKEFRFKDFYRTMSFVNAIAHIANQQNHHPDLEVGYNRCLVRYSTHAVKGLTVNDFICAARIDAL